MAKHKLDTTKLKGFDSLPDEIKSALSAYEVDVPDADYSGYVTKDVFDRKASEAAELNRKLQEKMTEDEKKQAADEALRKELEELRKEKTINEYANKYISLGFNPELAKATATAQADGKADVVFENLAKFKAESEVSLRQQILGGTPKPTTGTPKAPEPTATELDNLSDDEYFKRKKGS